MKKIKKIYCVFALLLVIGISPVFFRFDADGAVCFNNPWSGSHVEKSGTPLRYVNAFMGVAAYILVVVVLIALLRRLGREERRRRLLADPDFDRIFGADADAPGGDENEAKAKDGTGGLRREFLQEKIRVYFDKEGD